MCELNATTFDAKVAEGVTLVDFWAPWCGPCRMIAPIMEELSTEFEGKAGVCKVNADENGDLMVKFGIRGIPTVIVFKDGQPVETMVGANAKATYANKINEILGA